MYSKRGNYVVWSLRVSGSLQGKEVKQSQEELSCHRMKV
jgi:hypothetical protein